MSRYSAVEPLSPEHETEDFDCGSNAQSYWLQWHALQAQQAGTSRVYVVCLLGTRRVVGYHALAAGSEALSEIRRVRELHLDPELTDLFLALRGW